MSLSADATRPRLRGSARVLHAGGRFPLAAADLLGEAL